MAYVQYYDKVLGYWNKKRRNLLVISSLSNSVAGYDEIPASIMQQIIT